MKIRQTRWALIATRTGANENNASPGERPVPLSGQLSARVSDKLGDGAEPALV